MTPLQQEVFRLYHTEGLPLELVIESLARSGHHVGVEEVAETVFEIEEQVDRHYLRRLESNARARSLGVVSGRLLDFLAEMRLRGDSGDDTRPDRVLAARERETLMEEVRSLVEQLSEEEQEVLRLRYSEERTAREIADELGLGSQRRVYTILDRAVRKLRKLLGGNE
jgi:RNA polymerase sigma factor (sigma-70 family)